MCTCETIYELGCLPKEVCVAEYLNVVMNLNVLILCPVSQICVCVCVCTNYLTVTACMDFYLQRKLCRAAMVCVGLYV